jgi:restriction endonuclease S subunit
MHDWNISRAWAVISPRSDVDPDYLAVFLQSSYAQEFFRMRSTGSAQAVLNIAELKQLRVPLPPLPQQRRIAAAAELARRSAVAANVRMQMCQRLNRMLFGGVTA